MGWQERELSPGAGAREHLGFRMRELRKSNGMSLKGLSDVVRVDYSYLGKIERGAQLAHRDVIAACDSALRACGELLRLFDEIKNNEADRHNPGHVAGPALHVANHVANTANTLGESGPSSEAWDEDEADTVAVLGDDGRLTLVTVPRRLANRGAQPIRGGLILPGQAGRPDSPSRPIERFQAIRRTLADMDNMLGPLAVIPRAIEQFKTIELAAKTQRGSDMKDYLRILTQYADLIGWLHQDSGRFSQARRWLDRALELAHISGDVQAIVFIMSRKAQLAADMQDPLTAACIADAAVTQARPGSHQAAIAATYAARGHGLAGEEVEALTSYERAFVMLAAAEPDEAPWGKFFGEPYIGIQRSHSLAELGRFTEAADGFRAAINDLPVGFRRDEGVYLAWEAAAHAGAREPEVAVTLAAESLQIGLETKSSRIITELIGLAESLEPWKGHPEVQRFRSQLNASVRKHG